VQRIALRVAKRQDARRYISSTAIRAVCGAHKWRCTLLIYDVRPHDCRAAVCCRGGQAAGYAAADSVQALPLVSTFWGVLLFGAPSIQGLLARSRPFC